MTDEYNFKATERRPICDECETVAHCSRHGCIPKQPTDRELMQQALEGSEPRQWQGLTDAERIDLGVISEAVSAHSLIHMVEAKLREKNT